jgi:uncharacterized membrane protein
MLLYLIKTTDSLWLLATAVPIFLFVARAEGGAKRGFLWAGLALGLLDSLVYVYLRRNTGIVVRELYDLWILRFLLPLSLLWLIAAFFSLSPKDQKTWPRPVVRFLGPVLLALLLARALPDVLIYPLDFNLGMSSYFNFDFLMKCTGYLSGILLCVLVGAAIGWILRRAPMGAARCFLSLSFSFLLLNLLLEAFQIMFVRRMLPSFSFGSITPFVLVSFFLNHKVYFVFAQVVIWAILAVFLMARARTAKPAGDNPALVRKSRYGLILGFRAGVLLLGTMGTLSLIMTLLRAIEARGPYIADPTEVKPEDGELRLDLATVDDGNLHRRSYTASDGTQVRFLVVKKTANAYGVGLDACDICGASGYYQRGDQIVCKLCDVVMNKSTIGFPGGCNPVPLKFSIKNGKLVILASNLEEEKHRFQ